MGKRAIIIILATLIGATSAYAAETSPVPGLTAGDCQDPSSASVQALCVDPGLHSLLEGVRDVPYVRLGRDWTMDRALFQQCDATLDARACLEREYRVKIKAVHAESAKRASAYAPDGNTADAKALLARMTGVYKRSAKGQDADDVFELVAVADAAAYLRMSLPSSHGRSCAIAGIAEYKKIGSFVFQDPDHRNQCLLTVSLVGDEVGFSDPNGNCQKFCDAGGSLTEETFTLKQKKKIRYLPALRKSTEYQQAMQDYAARHGGVATAKPTP
ncbi:hypothetical protein [Nitrospirillum iridis]|uniref:YARHG domain-containing protein n=1 Tax=Nitrospirillum iridis TaxID=765888 RepID=A0A7X0AVG8_9PROT|nr:hypothetical protein [Nitrospirillum iridis]MBB6250835.1 hypothetical protein [Nitrospirillum iridis]